ncbi:MAG: hypothetical protein OXH96_09945 [Spirochaetaceae bacterium]|nr:hypothetical protein [Spirochaetaceae bacterium]
MKILFDHGTPAPLRGYIPEHTVDTAAEKGWAELSNGELLDQAASEEYELLITDQSMRYQQNLRRRRIAIIVLRSNRWPDVLMRVDDIRAALERIQPGELREVQI